MIQSLIGMHTNICLVLNILIFVGNLSLCFSLPSRYGIPDKRVIGRDKFTWLYNGADEIYRAVSVQPNTKVAKNIILFIGDGMGVSTVTAARILDGQIKGLMGEENQLYFDSYEHTALSKTYSVDKMTPDSAATATAIMTGVKTNVGVLGMDGKAMYNNCSYSMKNSEKLDSILRWAQKAGKRTGIVTTSRITHATPAASYAHSPNRDWEGDVNMKHYDAPCKDIARQLIEDNTGINVLLGGGRRYFLPKKAIDPETGRRDGSQRKDGRNLIKEWKAEKGKRNKTHRYVWNRKQLLAVNGPLEYLLGLFNPSHMNYERDRQKKGLNDEPSLAEMTNKAIDVLSQGQNGYFLIVEGARIDHGHHDNKAKKALYDVIAFDRAVQAAGSRPESKPETTLSIVTADHSHVFNIVGYPVRGTDILGLVHDEHGLAQDEKGNPYTILHYSNGPSYAQNLNLTKHNTTTDWFRFPAAVPLKRESHGAEDVAIYAKGPMSHLVRGTQEQTYIAYVMAYSACIGPFEDFTDKTICSVGRVK